MTISDWMKTTEKYDPQSSFKSQNIDRSDQFFTIRTGSYIQDLLNEKYNPQKLL